MKNRKKSVISILTMSAKLTTLGLLKKVVYFAIKIMTSQYRSIRSWLYVTITSRTCFS